MGHQSPSIQNSLIRQDFGGTYCLGFLNSFGLEVEEIRTIFSDFGKVVNIKETGDKTGYRFVRYQYADEAENAIEGLKTHSKIRLVEHRPKNNRKSDSHKNENKNQNGNEKRNSNENFNGNENKYGNEYYKKDNQNCNGNFQKKDQDSNGYNKEIDRNSDEIYAEKNQNNKKICEEIQVQNNEYSKNNSSNENLNNNNFVLNAKSSNNLNSIPDNDVMKHNSLSSSLSVGCTYIEDDNIPDLVKNEKLKIVNNTPKTTILKAEEIIVGNIPNNFGSAFILHLFERYHPIAISDIHFVKNSATRYCHVYFTTVQDSLNVEKTFDHMNLSGQKLLVLRPSKLIKEAAC